MKKLSLILAVTSVLLLTSCASGWSCQKRYVQTKQVKITEQKKNA